MSFQESVFGSVRKMLWGLAIALPLSIPSISMTASAQVSAPLFPQTSPTGNAGDSTEWQAAYVLGPGDRVRINAFGAEDYSGEALILPDGSLILPRVGSISVQGMTLEQAAQAVATKYAPFLRRPMITVNLVSQRPVKVAVSGEVNRPGSYIVTSSEAGTSAFPTLTQAIRSAGGITSRADLSQVQVQRQLSQGREQVIRVNLWELLETGNLNRDVILQGGDTVTIPTVQAISPGEAVRLGTASFAPDNIQIYVVGEVAEPGTVEVPLNTPMNQALLAAGGFRHTRAATRSVRLVRLNPDGTVTRREIPVDFSSGINDNTNPILQNNDVIVIGRTGIASFSDSVNPVLDVISRFFSSIFLFDIFR